MKNNKTEILINESSFKLRDKFITGPQLQMAYCEKREIDKYHTRSRLFYNFTPLLVNTGYISIGKTLVTVYWISENEIVLIDSGEKERFDFLTELEERNISVRAVINTHLHSDHTANNRELLKRFNAKFYASIEEIRTTQIPEGMYTVIESEGVVNVDGVQFKVMPTPGHTKGHLAIITPDNVCCLGDAVMTKRLIKASRMPYMVDVQQAFESIKKIGKLKCPFFVISHRGVVPISKLTEVINLNMEKECEILAELQKFVISSIDFEELITLFMREIGIERSSFLEDPYLREATSARIYYLNQVGILKIKKGKVYL